MEKSEQWKLAAIIIKLVDQHNPEKHITRRDQLAVLALNAVYAYTPWEYPWLEVVRSHRARSANRLAKSRTQV